MADVTLQHMTNGQNISVANNNFDKIQDNINNHSLQSDSGNNVMYQDLDLNSHSLLNAKTNVNNPGSVITVADGDNRYYLQHSIPSPLNPSDAVNKGYVDALNLPQGFFQQLGTNAVQRSWTSKARDVYNCKDYGCAVDGVTNDTTALNNLNVYLGSLGGGTIVIPKGTICITGITLQPGVTLEGEQKVGSRGYFSTLSSTLGSSIIKMIGTGNIITLSASCGINGVSIYGAGSAVAGKGIYAAAGSNYCYIKNVFITNMADEAIHLLSTANAVEDILAFNCLLNRTRAAVTGVVRLEGSDSYASRIEANTSLTDVFNASNLQLAAFYVGGSNHFISNCVGEISEFGWYVTSSGSGHRLVSCRGDLNWGPSFFISAGNPQLTNCTGLNSCRGTGVQGLRSSFEFLSTQGASLSNCKAICSGAYNNFHKYGFDLNYSGSGNDFSAASSRNILDSSCRSAGHLTASYNQTVTHAHGIDVPMIVLRGTGATPNVDGVKQYKPTDSTAVTVTNFLNGVIGQRLVVEGNTNITLQHGTNIFNKTSANLTLANNMVYEYICTAANKWVQL